MNELIQKYDEYIEFLNEANSDIVGIAYTHGWRCSQEVIDKGIQLREEIKNLKEKL